MLVQTLVAPGKVLVTGVGQYGVIDVQTLTGIYPVIQVIGDGIKAEILTSDTFVE